MIDNSITFVIQKAQNGDNDAMMELIRFLQPILVKRSTINGRRDDDLMQHLIVCAINATKDFRF